MDHEEVIRQKMEDTRTSLTEKLETLENKVADTVKGATEAVNDTVDKVKDSVQETVTTVKDSVQDAVGAVKETVQSGVTTVKDWLDVRAHVENHPWCSMAVAVCAGYCLETILEPKAPAPHGNGFAAGGKHHNGQGRTQRRHAPKSGALLSEFGPEINQLKGLALGTLFGVARDMLSQALPGDVGQRLGEIIDSTTRKLGGEPIHQETLRSQSTVSRFGHQATN